jgi:hypothetical protein
VALVNQSFAARYWPNQNPLGKRIMTDISDKSFVVVGMTKNSNFANLNPDPGPLLYLSADQVYRPAMTVHVRVAGNPRVFARTLETTVHELNSDLPLFDVTTLKSTIQFASVSQRIAGTFVGAFGLLALALAAVGGLWCDFVYHAPAHPGVGAAARAGRGAQPGFQAGFGPGLRLALIGISIGLVVSVLLTRFLKNQLVGVTSTDALTFSAVSVLLCLVALVACFVPGWRATRVDPMAALRYE